MLHEHGNNGITRRGAFGAAAALAGAVATTAAAPSAMATGRPPAPGAPVRSTLSRPDRIFLAKGLRHGAWVAQDSFGWAPTARQFRASGFTEPTWYDAPLWRDDLMDGDRKLGWSATKGPKGFHLKGNVGDIPETILSADQRERLDGLFTFCMGDEENYSDGLHDELAGLFAKMRVEAPNALLHTNQYSGQWSDFDMKRFMKASQPDLLTFDNYYFGWENHRNNVYAGGSITGCYNSLATYRNWAMLGNDLSGRNPIQFGQYTLGFRPGEKPYEEGNDFIISQSQQYLPSYATWTFGGRWLDLFRWQKGDNALLTRADGSSTLQAARYTELNRQLRVLSPYLTRLRSRTVSIVLGRNSAGTNAQPNLSLFSKDTDPGTRLTNITATNIGGANNGLPGDVLVGTFRPIPGMNRTEAGMFQDSKTPAFMVTNALAAPNTDPRQEKGVGGNGSDTRQRIVLRFDLDSSVNPGRLRTLNARTGRVEHVTLRRTSSKAWEAALVLDGGTGQLLWWDEK